MNNTVGELEVLSWQHYSLGVFLGLTFISISVVNILFLKCFYNLRKQAFVRNSVTFISLIATDLVNAIILTPTLLSWFLLPSPNSYTSCLIKSLPFMLSNYTSLLNMTCFCVYRFIIIKNVSLGRMKTPTSKYSLTTLGICVAAVISVSLPYILWNNSDRIILDCRRAVFSDANSALCMFSLLYDIPLILMNFTLFILLIFFKKHQVKVSTGFTSELSQSNRSNVIENESFGQGTVKNSNRKKSVNDFQESCKELTYSSSKSKTLTEKLAHGGKPFEDDSSSLKTADMFQINVIPVSVESSSSLATANNVYSKVYDTGLDSYNRHESMNSTGRHFEKHKDMINNRLHQTDAVHGNTADGRHLEMQSTNPTDTVNNRHRKNEEKGHLINELKQSLVTMGILVAIYDVTVLPLIIDINMGARDLKFLMPHVLNSFCFLNSFANPLVYLIRMKKMRQEMKSILRHCCCKVARR